MPRPSWTCLLCHRREYLAGDKAALLAAFYAHLNEQHPTTPEDQ